jgi:RNA:NAD 2'-phosphotransferase (TPT1/KptA family)
MARRDTETSKAMSHALRHDPAAYGLELAADGSVTVTGPAHFRRRLTVNVKRPRLCWGERSRGR